jgi:hypothetical protein
MDEKVSKQGSGHPAQQQDEAQLGSYAAPRLRYLGSVKDLTLTTAKNGGTFDGGFLPRAP